MKKDRFEMQLAEGLKNQLRLVSEASHRSMSQFIVDRLVEYFDAHPIAQDDVPA